MSQLSLRLLLRPSPLQDELLLSWLTRISIENRVKLNSICWLITGRRAHLLGGDTDWTVNAKALARIEDITGYTQTAIRQMLLIEYQERIVGFQLGAGLRRWILPVKTEGQQWKGHGQQFCPSCLQEGTPYFRRSWRLAFAVICERHREFLHDCCPACGAAVNFFRNLHNISNFEYVSHLARCSFCKFDLRHSSSTHKMSFTNDLTGFVSSLFQVLATGWLRHANTIIYSNLYFDGLHRLGTVMLSGRRGHRLLSAILAEMGGLQMDHGSNIRGKLEDLRVTDRALVMSALAWVMANWPDNFVGAVERAQLRRDDFVDFHAPPPFWLASVCQEHLGLGRRIRSVEERKSVELFLKKNGLSTSANNVNRWLGGWHVLKNKASRQGVLEIAKQIRQNDKGYRET